MTRRKGSADGPKPLKWDLEAVDDPKVQGECPAAVIVDDEGGAARGAGRVAPC